MIVAPAMLLAVCLTVQIAPPTAQAPAEAFFEVVVEDARLLADQPDHGRVIVFLKACTSTARGEPSDAPFFEDPQPMYSVEVGRLAAGHPIKVGASAQAFPVPIAQLRGCFKAQAVLDRSSSHARHSAPGNLTSEVVEVTLGSGLPSPPHLVLNKPVARAELPQISNVVWFDRPSALLSAHFGRPISHRAGVVLPIGYDDPDHARRYWPTIYVIPGFGADHLDAVSIAQRIRTPGTERLIPQAVWVVLDPEGPYGHHLFADSECNGPRARALVSEFIPALEERFRIVAKPEARIVTGHSSGGWSSLWLALNHPEVFGAAFSSAPDPVDFASFQTTDIGNDDNVFVNPQGKERPSFRSQTREIDDVRMTNRQEISMERVLGPRGDSGQQWDSWAAVFSPKDLRTGLPKRLYDPVTGVIDHAVAAQWSRYDISRRVFSQWEELAPLLAKRIHLLCGSRDSFYLNLAVESLQRATSERASIEAASGHGEFTGDGYIEIAPLLDHGTLVPVARLRFDLEMSRWLRGHGLGE